MTRVFVFTNHKGGVGKSTSATNIAFGMVGVLRKAEASNCRVLLIDTDSQAHATLVTTSKKDYGADNSLYTVLMADRQNAAKCVRQLHCSEYMGCRPACSACLSHARRCGTRIDGCRRRALPSG